MSKPRVKKLAEDFESIANKYASDASVDKLIKSLKEVILNAKAGSITAVVDNVPGEYFFQEGGLSKYADLEIAYSKLKLALIIEDKQHDGLISWAEKRKQELFDKK